MFLFHPKCKPRRIRDLGLAKQRFDSHSRPLGRLIVWFEAVVMTAVWISTHRRGEDVAQCADEFLVYITEERLLQLAMVADGGDDALGLTRFLDTEDYELAQLPMELHAFINKLNGQFVQGLCVSTGYTKYVIAMCQRSHGYFVNGEPHTFGGKDRINPAMVQRCLARMCCWVKLAIQTIEAEFPSFSLLRAFQIFDLTTRARQRRAQDPEQAAFRAQCLTQQWLLQQSVLFFLPSHRNQGR